MRFCETKKKRMQAMIITSHPDRVIKMIHKKLHRGVNHYQWCRRAYNHEQKTVLIAIITRAEFNEFKTYYEKKLINLPRFSSRQCNIIGRFVESDRLTNTTYRSKILFISICSVFSEKRKCMKKKIYLV